MAPDPLAPGAGRGGNSLPNMPPEAGAAFVVKALLTLKIHRLFVQDVEGRLADTSLDREAANEGFLCALRSSLSALRSV